MGSTTQARRMRPDAAKGSQPAPKRRVTQESINEMAALRRQGLTFQGIGARLGCSERTARRYVGQVRSQLQLPEAVPESTVEEPHRMRDWLARFFSNILYHYKGYPEPSLSVAFLAEATRLIEESLEALPALTLELLMNDPALRIRFLKEATGSLYLSYRHSVRFEVELGHMEPAEAARLWARNRELGERLGLEDEGPPEV
jgi:hypothetical protein